MLREFQAEIARLKAELAAADSGAGLDLDPNTPGDQAAFSLQQLEPGLVSELSGQHSSGQPLSDAELQQVGTACCACVCVSARHAMRQTG